MTKNRVAISFLLILQNTHATLFNTKLIGTESCLNLESIKHIPGKPWEIIDLSSEWIIDQEQTESPLTGFSLDTSVKRTVEPSHNMFSSKLATIQCDYASGTLILKRTYEEKKPPFPDATYIGADSNVDNQGMFKSHFVNWQTTCTTTMSSLTACQWMFLKGLYDTDVPWWVFGSGDRYM